MQVQMQKSLICQRLEQLAGEINNYLNYLYGSPTLQARYLLLNQIRCKMQEVMFLNSLHCTESAALAPPTNQLSVQTPQNNQCTPLPQISQPGSTTPQINQPSVQTPQFNQPNVPSPQINQPGSATLPSQPSLPNLPAFSLAELAQYNGKNGKPAYVAVNGTVYDVTNIAAWAAAAHFGLSAGRDLTYEFATCHQGQPILNILKIVGKIG